MADTTTPSDSIVEQCARAAHASIRLYALSLGDKSHEPWEHETSANKNSMRDGVRAVLVGGADAKAVHESWLAARKGAGWTFGAEKDPAKKTHPCLVEYDALPQVQQIKDTLFVSVVSRTAAAYGYTAHVQPKASA